jgi:HK97 family phage prohead protease
MVTAERTEKRRRDVSGSLAGLQVRAEGDTPKTLSGYGAVFYRASEPGSEYWLWSDLVERLMPGCFDRALKEDDVRSFFNHEPDSILARRAFAANDTLKLGVDDIGLRYEIAYDATDEDLVGVFGKVRSGKVTGSSFMFVPTKETYRSETDPETKARVDIIEITEVRLFEVGPVVFPAYDATTSEVRRRMASDFTTAEREARERRNAASEDDRAKRLRHRVAVDSKLRSVAFPRSKR